MIFFLLLFFLYPIDVFSKGFVTPYLEVGEVSSDYKVSSNEKIKVVTYYNLEKIDEDFKWLEEGEKDSKYTVKTDEVKYGEYTSWSKEKLNGNYLEEERTVYYYQDLRKINSFILKIEDLLVNSVVIKYKEEIIYSGDNIISDKLKIKLNDSYSPIDLSLEISCFLNQSSNLGTISLIKDNYINNKVDVTDKGFNKLDIKLKNCLERLEYDSKINKSTEMIDEFYKKVIRKEKEYRYRKKYYKYVKEKESLVSKEILDGYKVLDSFNKYYLYRSESIELYDDIVLTDYLDLDKIIKKSTIPLSFLNFNYIDNFGNSNLVISYKDFKAEVSIKFNYSNYDKSNVKKGKESSFGRNIFNILFNLLFMKKLTK